MPIAIIANPRIKTRKELLQLTQALHNAEITSTIIIGNLGLDPEEYANLLPNTFFLSGAEDDIRITKQARKLNALLDGNIVKVDGLTVAGIGGIDPHQNMERVLKLTKTSALVGRIDITLSYHPPRGCGDLIETINVRRGLDELKAFLEKARPVIHVCSGEQVYTCSINSTKTYVLGKGEVFALINNHGKGFITVNVLPLKTKHIT